ncbi:MAG: hypothetical protein QOJ68_2104, partial [Blastococcus sp.]|nr:hypothetical protein [Blastococcus sp.]
LLADHLTQDPPEEADVLAQRSVVGTPLRLVGGDAVWGAEVGDVDSGFRHSGSIGHPCDADMSWWTR